MAFTVGFNCQGQPALASVNLTGDEFSITTDVAAGATEVTNIGVIPNNIVEIVILADIGGNIDCGTNSPTTFVAGVPLVWCTGCGLTAPFAGAAVVSFTIVSTEGSAAGSVKIMGKTSNS